MKFLGQGWMNIGKLWKFLGFEKRRMVVRSHPTGQVGAVEVDSQWTAKHLERAGVFLKLEDANRSRKSPAQAKLGRGTLESNFRLGHPPPSPQRLSPLR